MYVKEKQRNGCFEYHRSKSSYFRNKTKKNLALLLQSLEGSKWSSHHIKSSMPNCFTSWWFFPTRLKNYAQVKLGIISQMFGIKIPIVTTTYDRWAQKPVVNGVTRGPYYSSPNNPSSPDFLPFIGGYNSIYIYN